MKRRLSTFITTLIIVFILWQIWQKLHIVVWINIPWWGALLLIVALFVVIDLVMDRLIGRERNK